jgi:ribosomal protein S1
MQTSKKEQMLNDFAWDVLASESRMIANQRLKTNKGEKVFCHMPYAGDMLKMIQASSDKVLNKEPKIGKLLNVIDLISFNESEIVVALEGMIEATVQISQEKKFFQLFNMNTESFMNMLNSADGKTLFLGMNNRAVIESIHPFTKASLYAGYVQKQKEEFFSEITKPTSAYEGIITGKNQGGFIINIGGIEGFLPGSLAAANIVRDFDDMIGKKVTVMVEDYLQKSDIFVFSYKKYISKILPSAIEQLNLESKYSGSVTGVAKYGIFIEFNEIFTGLLHSSKMLPETRERFKSGAVKPGDEFNFWIKEITSDKKIILTDEDPSTKIREIEEFRESNLGTVKGGEVVSVQPFGALVKIQKDIVGLISQKEIRNKKKKFSVGDQVMVTVDKVQNNKIFLTIPNEV